MDYSIGDTLRVDGDIYEIIGKIQYKNLKDNCDWFEYRMRATQYSEERWLSIDDTYKEYSISKAAFQVSLSGYHIVDEGTEEVIGVWGDVDVAIGDQAYFKEYEDVTEEKIISLETWDDGEEQSVGYYLDLDEINFYQKDTGTYVSSSGSPSFFSPKGKIKNVITVLILIWFTFSSFIGSVFTDILSNTNIAKYLKNSSSYTYVTSITGGHKQKANVYKSSYSLDDTIYDILNAIEGNTENVQQNTENGDQSVAILTSKEYCLVYVSEDNDILVQISSRKYAYGSYSEPYHASRYTSRYYRRYYYSRGYDHDSSRYGKYYSPYTTFDDSYVDYSNYDTYNNYSSSVRQASVNARQSSGGGISSGK